MSHDLDPQISSALINASGGLLTGILGTLGAGRWRGRRRTLQEQKCERICASMVGMAETMLAVMKALGVNDPLLAPHIARMEIKIGEARAWLDENLIA